MIDLLPALKTIFEADSITQGGDNSKQAIYVDYGNYDAFSDYLQNWNDYPFIFFDVDNEQDYATSDNFNDSYVQKLSVVGYVGVLHTDNIRDAWRVNYIGDTDEWGFLELVEGVRRILYTNKTIAAPDINYVIVNGQEPSNFRYRRSITPLSTGGNVIIAEFNIDYFRIRELFPNTSHKYSHT